MRPIQTIFLLFLILAGCSQSPAQAEGLPEAEKKKIEHLIQHVANMPDAVFVRNGAEYKADSAAKFMRGKWNSNAAEVKSAKDFIEKCASVSSTSGKPYLIRFQDGKETPSGEFLSAELAKFEKQSP